MNILPKKRWHVRTKENIARVRRDLDAAKEEERQRLERVALAEQEARTTLLRQKAAEKRPELSAPIESQHVPERRLEHVNLFADLEEQERTFGTNKEHQLEKRLEKEADERKIGLLKYLGEGSLEFTKEIPWYQKAPVREPPKPAAKPAELPPLQKPAINPDKISVLEKIGSTTRKRKKSKKAKKHSKKNKHKRRRGESDSESDRSSDVSDAASPIASSSSADLEKLRAERMRREREEKLKAEALLRRSRGEPEPKAKVDEPVYEQRYSSQFNPNIARQNRRD